MRRRIALFMHVNSVAISQPETELPLYCGFRILEQEGAKLEVIPRLSRGGVPSRWWVPSLTP